MSVVNQPKIEDNIFQAAMRELSAMEMKEEVLLTISKLLSTRLAIFFFFSKRFGGRCGLGKGWQRTHTSV